MKRWPLETAWLWYKQGIKGPMMDEKDREPFERMAKAQEGIAAIMGKPESKFARALTIASLSAGVLGAGLFSILQKLLELFGG